MSTAGKEGPRTLLEFLTVTTTFLTGRGIEGARLDAELMRSYFAAWNDKNAYATAHLGWGMNRRARWDAMVMYDHGDHNGVEQRVFGGNFLFSTGANQFANRYTLGHFDLPLLRDHGQVRLAGRHGDLLPRVGGRRLGHLDLVARLLHGRPARRGEGTPRARRSPGSRRPPASWPCPGSR